MGMPTRISRDVTSPISTRRTTSARPAAAIGSPTAGAPAPATPASDANATKTAATKVERSRFRALQRLWKHPLGEVNAATDAQTGKAALITVLHAGSAVNDAMLEAARAACRSAAALPGVAIAKPIDVQRTADGRIALANEPFEGTPLVNISRNQPMPAARAIAILRQVTRELDVAHRAGLTHGAMSLASIVLRAKAERPDTVIVTDFGLGPLLDGTLTVLKEDAALQPTSPERISGTHRDLREDIYLLGCLGYTLLTGGPPFRTGTPEAVRRRHAIEDPMPILERMRGTRSVGEALAVWIHRCLAKDPEDRYRDMAEVEAALCIAQIEDQVTTPWDDLSPPAVDPTTMAKIRNALTPAATLAVATFATTPPDFDDEVTIMRAPPHAPPTTGDSVRRFAPDDPLHGRELIATSPVAPVAAGKPPAEIDHARAALGLDDDAEPPHASVPSPAGSPNVSAALDGPAPPTSSPNLSADSDQPAPPSSTPTVPAGSDEPAPPSSTPTIPAGPADQPNMSAPMAAAPPAESVPGAPSTPARPSSRLRNSTLPGVPRPTPRVSTEPSDRGSGPAVVAGSIAASAPSGTPETHAQPDPIIVAPGLGASSSPGQHSAGVVGSESPTPVVNTPVVNNPGLINATASPPVATSPAPGATMPQAPDAAGVRAARAPVSDEAQTVALPTVAVAASIPAIAPPSTMATQSGANVLGPQVLPSTAAPPRGPATAPWPTSAAQLTSTGAWPASGSLSDMDRSMVAAVHSGRRGLWIVLALASIGGLGYGAYFVSQRSPPQAPVVQATPVAPTTVGSSTAPIVEDPAADMAATPADLVAAGDRARQAGRASDAEALYQRAIVREPKHLGALLGLGHLRLDAGDAERASGYFRRAVTAAPKNGDARVGLGDALVKLGNVGEARKQYKKAKQYGHPAAAARLAQL